LISYYLSIFLYTIVFKVVKEKMDEGEDIANTKKTPKQNLTSSKLLYRKIQI